MSSLSTPDYEAVEQASRRLAGVAHRTPVLTSTTLNRYLGAELYFKCENFQRAGAFKFRGAYNAISSLSQQQRQHGLVAFSSGNHAQAVALAASLHRTKVTVIMPTDAPPAKKAAALGYGATVIEYDRQRESREAMAEALVHEQGLTLIPPFNAPAIIAGQGTAAKELFEEVGGLDVLFTPMGGGGLLSGTLLAAQGLSPACRIYGVEPEAGNDGQQSLQQGRLVSVEAPQSIADGALTTSMSPLTFSIAQRYAAGVLTVDDQALMTMMRFFAERMKMVVEPTGCLGAAAALSEQVDLKGLRVGVIVSGGNVDIAKYGHYLALGKPLQC